MEDVLNNAAIQGNLDALILMHGQGVPITPKTLQFAKLAGHLHVLEYAYRQGCVWDKWPPPADLAVLQWLHDNGCGEWGWPHNICDAAARNGRLDVVKYVHENGCQLTRKTFSAATRHEGVLRYLLNNNCLHFHNSADDALNAYFPIYGPKLPPPPPSPPSPLRCFCEPGELGLCFVCADGDY